MKLLIHSTCGVKNLKNCYSESFIHFQIEMCIKNKWMGYLENKSCSESQILQEK